MHDLEPFYNWRHFYVADEDPRSPFYGREYSEMYFTDAVYNYLIHPQWDYIGSPTLYIKILYADYEQGFAVIELLGEWNDLIHNDIMFLKREIIDALIHEGIYRYLLIGENVLNGFTDDDSYYEEWYEDISEEGGWIVMAGFLPHVMDEFKRIRIRNYAMTGEAFDKLAWRKFEPFKLMDVLEERIIKGLPGH